MTRNQIDYAKLLETQRANMEQEDITRRRDQTNRELGLRAAEETERANRERELFNRDSLSESARHNLASESQAALSLHESTRHNTELERIQAANQYLESLKLAENQRANKARESETIRHNVATETENYRSAIARETETHRSNLASESLGYSNIGARYAELGSLNEFRRQDLALSGDQLAETIRNNVERVSETRRHNKAQEDISRDSLSESERASKEKEKLGWFNAGVNAAGTAVRAFNSVIGRIS